ncbi:FIST C-terminal domain-containing protein [Christensenellaceae bacterium OttesenSCG-928-M15]|nr:FIST C-terminal domain-containing protein [Christensenellaceae bacterium OttesenSCG-928-M15]
MIKSATLFTYELDSPEFAFRELNAQLLDKIELLKNTVGILMCDPEFIDAGVLEYVADRLPFPIAGASTMCQAVNGETGILMLSLMVLTSDDVEFSVGATQAVEPFGENIERVTKDAYIDAAKQLSDVPKLIIAFPPLIAENGGDQYVEAFEAVCPNVPIFGTLAVEDDMQFLNCYNYTSAACSKTLMSFILVSGNVNPRFHIATISNDRALPYTGEITKSYRHIVHEINNLKCSDYFESIGFSKDGVLDKGLQFVPYLLDFNKREDYDGIPVVRAMVYFDENGHGVCRGYMYENSVFTLTNPTDEDVLKTSEKTFSAIAKEADAQAILIFSCMVRKMTLGSEPLKEATLLLNAMPPQTPFMLAYAGGEICPTTSTSEKVTNRFHNYSLIALIL